MERPWLLLRRVLDVGLPLPVLQAHAEEHGGVVVDAEADADVQAQEQQHAGVEEVEEHEVAAEDAAMEAQAQHDAVAQAEEDAQAQQQQHAGVEEAEEHDVAGEDALAHLAAVAEAQAEADALAQGEQHAGVEGDAAAQDAAIEAQIELEESVMNVNTDHDASVLAHEAMDAGAPDFAITVARPPRVSSLFAGLRSFPDPQRPDMYPYIIATGRFCLLVHFAVAPFYGTNFAEPPNHSHLVVVRHFLRAADEAQIVACAVAVPERPVVLDDDDFIVPVVPAVVPELRNIESVGLVCDQETDHYQIAELIVPTGAAEAAVVFIRTDTGFWDVSFCGNPLLATEDPHRDWVPHGTVTVHSTVFWFDLSWGLLSCDLGQPPLLQELTFHRLPPGRKLLDDGDGPLPPDLHCRRCIAVSENLVRYVEIILNYPPAAATVNMWCRDLGDNGWRWQTNYSERFQDIWAHESYQQTGLPQNPPMLVGVSPVDSNVVYFSLDQRLFGVNVPERTVVDCEPYEPLNRPGPHDEPVTSRYFIIWNLEADAAPNVGHQPDNPSDHSDSNASGPADEGEIEYETPPE